MGFHCGTSGERRGSLFLLAFSVVWVLGCSDRDPELGRARAFSLRLASTASLPPTEFVVVLTDQAGTTRITACPGAPAGGTHCTATGIEVDTDTAQSWVTVKSRGYETASHPVGGETALEIELLALAESTITEHYATGLSPEMGAEDYARLALPVSTEFGEVQLVKFLLTGSPGAFELFLQNTRRYPLHYDFSREVLGVRESLTEFEANTYHGLDRVRYAGTLTTTAYPTTSDESTTELLTPLLVSFFPSDDLTPKQVLDCQLALEARLGMLALAGEKERLAYLPAGDLAARALQESLADFARSDAPFVTHEQLFGQVRQQLMNEGLAYGTLRAMTLEELRRASVSFTDILLLKQLPNHLQVVGGTITEELQTPLAHVNVAARARGTPNLALLEASTDPRIAPLLGKLVRFSVGHGTFSLEATTLPEAEAFWASRVPEPMIPDCDLTITGLPELASLGFSSQRAVGVKAANLAELHRLMPDVAPNGFAVPFAHYDQHLHRGRLSESSCAAAGRSCVAEGRPAALCDAAESDCASLGPGLDLFGYAEHLLGEPRFITDSEYRAVALAGLRHHVQNLPLEPAFAVSLDARVTQLFGASQVRLRSSTNAEDLPRFSGAGLYESVSAQGSKPPASLRIGEVFASVWSTQAFEERAFWGIDQLAVRMGVLVGPAFDDEAVNGVLITQNIADPTVAGMYVNVQQGEVSVTNPSDGSLPEVFSIILAPSGLQVARARFSSLSEGVSLLSETETATLYAAATEIVEHFAPLYGQDPNALLLDMEFKLVGPERALVIKQVRPYID